MKFLESEHLCKGPGIYEGTLEATKKMVCRFVVFFSIISSKKRFVPYLIEHSIYSPFIRILHRNAVNALAATILPSIQTRGRLMQTPRASNRFVSISSIKNG